MGQILIFVIIFLILFVVFVLAAAVMNFFISRRWQRNPDFSGKLIDAGGYHSYLRVLGKGSPAIVIQTWGGGPSFEWWNIQDKLSELTTVVTLDRAGYGWSGKGNYPRTSARIVEETRCALKNAGILPPYILVGHSQGGYYMDHFARLYPAETAAVALIDPLTLDNSRWYDRFPQHKMYYDKSSGLRMGRLFAVLGLVRLFKMEAYPRIPFSVRKIVNEHYSKPEAFKAMLSEMETTVLNGNEVKAAGPFPDVPLKVIFPSPECNMKNWIDYGVDEGLTKEMETLHKELARLALDYTTKSEWIIAENSTHAIHLDVPDFLVQQLGDLLKKAVGGNT